MKRIFLFLAVVFFAAAANSQSITVTAPNGGELLSACQTYVIKWTATGTSNFYDIDYSLNNGATWASVATNINVTNGQFTWTVPNVESDICLMRVRDKNNVVVEDISDAVFFIHIPIIVTAPNGGETLVPNAQHTITWDIRGTSTSFSIDYSINGGTTWTSVVANLSTSIGTYNWTVPNTPSTNCLVRVRDAVTSCMADVSNAAFTILPLPPTMTAPNGGNTFSWNQPTTINWLSSTYYGANVRLEYSIDNGVSWILIIASTPNDGSQSWIIPTNVNSTTCLVKVSDATTVTLNDVSNATFSIVAPKLTMVAPNGGEPLLGCNTTSIQYTLSGTNYIAPTISLSYSRNNGSTWSTITSTSLTQVSGIQTYTWTVPNTTGSDQCLMRATSTNFPVLTDTSDAVFSIVLNKPITITSPNGGETFAPGSSQTISWTNTAQASGLYNIFYSTDGGTTLNTIAVGVTGNSYVWSSVANAPSTNCVIRVTDQASSCKFDVSDTTFTIGALQPTMTAPNGGNVFSWNQPTTINWLSSTYYGANVRLEYSIDNGVSWILIIASTPNDGSQSWIIPTNVNSTTCLVKVSDATTVTSNDVSNATFSIIAPKLTMIAPNGGESLLGCNTTSIQYTLTGTNYIAPTISLSYSRNNGSTWSTITSTALSLVSGIQTYTWTVPNTTGSDQCLMRATSSNFPVLTDTSDAVFSIVLNRPITITSPNGGETFAPGSSQTISWTNTAQASGLYNIFYSTDGGTTLNTIAVGVSGNSYVWSSVANVPSTNCVIRVTDQASSCKFDVSDTTFTIGALQPTMTAPNGGNTFSWNQPTTINWLSSTYYGANVRLEYSIDNGLSWILIISSTPNDGSQSWIIPTNVNSTTCLVKVSDATTVTSNDVSNATFSIIAPKLTMVAPNGGESLLGCNATSIQYTLTGTNYIAPTISLSYSRNNGSTWSTITSTALSLVSGLQTYTWTVPNTTGSDQCLLRATSTNFPVLTDTSDAVFSIVLNKPITITSPNGGETFAPGSSQTISWTNTAQASGLYNIFYSTDGGTTLNTIAVGVTGNSYVWSSVANVPSTNCVIMVTDQASSCKSDQSDAAFTITALTPTMTYPNGGEVFFSLVSVNITWLSSTYYGANVRLEYSVDNGVTWNLIIASTPNDGSQSWTLPFANSTKCLVKVSDAGTVTWNDVSNAVFTITPIIQVTNPNGLDELGSCTQTSITFNHPSNYTSFDIAYSLNNGTTWSTIVNAYTQTGTTGSYSWTIPNVSSTRALIRVSPNGSPAYGDISDTTFKINPAVTLIQPNFGGTLQVGTVFPIKWISDGISNLYDLAYSTTSAAGPWTDIVTGYNTTTSTYNWTVPNILSANCYIRVKDNAAACKLDISNLPFTISATPPPLTVTAPNGQDTLLGCQNTNITWTETGAPAGNYKIELSQNGGTTWTVIESNYVSTSGSYSWTVPNTNSTQALVRVSAVGNTAAIDASDAAITITDRNIIASRDTIICAAGTVQLTATGGLGTYSWTPAFGLNNAFIANPVATITESMKYVVSSSNGACVISDTVSITLAKPIKVTVEVNTPVVCAGTTARFTAHVTDAVAATYQWKKNNVNIGSSDSVLSVNNIVSSDVFTCTVSTALPCISTAESAGVSATAYQFLGKDTTVVTSCASCTSDLTSIYNTLAYPLTNWSTTTPAAARLGIYSVIVTGGSCRDTAIVNVNANDGNSLRGCPTGNFIFQSDISGSTYQWQQSIGFGYSDLVNGGKITGATSATLQLSNTLSSLNGAQYRCLVDGVNYSTVKTLKITTLWTGAVSTDWNNAANWSCGRVPDTNTDIFIYSGLSNYPVVTTSVTCRSISCAPGTSVAVNTGGAILLSGK